MSDARAIKIDRGGNFVRVGPALCVNGTWCFDPVYRPTLCSSEVSAKRAITMWKNRTGTEKVVEK